MGTVALELTERRRAAIHRVVDDLMAEECRRPSPPATLHRSDVAGNRLSASALAKHVCADDLSASDQKRVVERLVREEALAELYRCFGHFDATGCESTASYAATGIFMLEVKRQSDDGLLEPAVFSALTSYLMPSQIRRLLDFVDDEQMLLEIAIGEWSWIKDPSVQRRAVSLMRDAGTLLVLAKNCNLEETVQRTAIEQVRDVEALDSIISILLQQVSAPSSAGARARRLVDSARLQRARTVGYRPR